MLNADLHCHSVVSDGTLERIGVVELSDGVRLRLDHAVRIVLDDLDEQARDNREVDADRWRRLDEDLAYLHRLAQDMHGP